MATRKISVMEGNTTDIRKLNGKNAQGLHQPSTDLQTEVVTSKIKPLLQLVANQCKYYVNFAKLGLSDLLAKAVRTAAIRKSLNFVLQVNFPRHIESDVIDEESLGNITILEDSMIGFWQLKIAVIIPSL